MHFFGQVRVLCILMVVNFIILFNFFCRYILGYSPNTIIEYFFFLLSLYICFYRLKLYIFMDYVRSPFKKTINSYSSSLLIHHHLHYHTSHSKKSLCVLINFDCERYKYNLVICYRACIDAREIFLRMIIWCWMLTWW